MEEIRERLLAVDEELKPFVPYLSCWAGQRIEDTWKLVAIIESAIEQYVEEAGGTPATKGALVHFAPEIVEALAGKNGFADEVKKNLMELLNRIGQR